MSHPSKLRTRGKIIQRSGSLVKVNIQVPDREECAGCDACRKLSEKEIWVSAGDQFAEGEEIVLEVPAALLTRVSFYIYFIPSIFVMTGFIWGYFWKGELAAALLAVVFLVMSFIAVKEITKHRYNDIVQLEKAED